MPGRWATTQEWEWLVALVPEWTRRSALGERKAFIEDMTNNFMATFPITAGAASDIERFGAQRALEIANYKRKKELSNWYYNNTRPSSGVGARGTLRPTKTKKKHAWQAYSKLYWDKGLEQKTNNLCMVRYNKRLDEFGPKERFPIRNKLIKELLALETEDVLKKVDDWRESEAITKPPLTNKVLAENIRKLPKTMKVFSDMIDEETDWVGGMILGGPDPLNGGETMKYIRVWGTNKDGMSFEQYLGGARYKKWVRVMKKWIESCYDEQDRQLRKLDGHEAPVRNASDDELGSDDDYDDFLDDESDESNNEEEEASEETVNQLTTGAPDTPAEPQPLQSANKSNQPINKKSNKKPMDAKSKSTDKENTTPTASGSTANRVAGGSTKSTYEMSREALMARNKVIMSVIEKTVTAGTVREALVGELQAVGVVMAEDQLTFLLDSINEIFDKSNKASSEASATDPENASSTTNVTAAGSNNDTLDTNGKDGSTSSTTKDNAISSGLSTTTPNPDSTNFTADVQPTSGGATPNAEGPGGQSAIDGQPASGQSTIGQPTSGQSTIDGQPASGSKASEGASGDAMDVDRSTEPTEPETPLSLEGVTVPIWMKATWPYLLGLSIARPWRSLLLAFANWESTKPKTGNLSTESRPKQVQAWIRSHKKDIPPDVNVKTFSAAFLVWYKNLQPSWRVVGVEGTDPSAFSRQVPTDASWGCIRHGGSAGFYTLLMALSWWVVKARDAVHLGAAPVIADMTWLLQHFEATPPSDVAVSGSTRALRGSSKRTNDGAIVGRSSKRRR